MSKWYVQLRLSYLGKICTREKERLGYLFCGAQRSRGACKTRSASKRKSAAHLDPIVGPVVIAQVSIEDIWFIADDALSGKIVLACDEK